MVLVRYIGGGGGGWEGVMMSMRMRLLCCVSLVLCFVHWCGGGEDGGISHRFLRCFSNISGQRRAYPRLFAPASLDFHVFVFDLRAGVRRGG